MAFTGTLRKRQGLGRALRRAAQACALLVGLCSARSGAAWEPFKPVELIVPAGRGGGADRMARLLQDAITRHGLLRQPVVVINKSGGDGAEAFLHVRASSGNPHKLLLAQSNLFTTPLASGMAFGYRDVTPVAMMALDQFVLWVNTDTPYTHAGDFFDAIRSAPPLTFSLGGTGLKQEDQLLNSALQQALGTKLTYVSFRGGGEVAAELAAGRVSCTVNNPLEALEHWRASKVRPLCVFRSEQLPPARAAVAEQTWSQIPTCKSAGVEVDYQMLRGLFLPGGTSPAQATFYADLLQRVRELPEWKAFVDAGALEDRFLAGPAFHEWLEQADALHRNWMRAAQLLRQ